MIETYGYNNTLIKTSSLSNYKQKLIYCYDLAELECKLLNLEFNLEKELDKTKNDIGIWAYEDYIVLNTVIFYNIGSLSYACKISYIFNKDLILIISDKRIGKIQEIFNRTLPFKRYIYYLLELKIDEYLNYIGMVEQELVNLEDCIRIDELINIKKRLLYTKRTAIVEMGMFDFLIDSTKYYDDTIKPFLYNLTHRLKEVTQLIDICLETILMLRDKYKSDQSERLNSSMRALTLITVFFSPLTFLVGVYGTNFVHLPEIYWEYGYFAMWGVIILLSSVMIIFFKKKEWI